MGGFYKILSDFSYDVKLFMYKQRKMMEDSIDMNYRIIQDGIATEKKCYTIELPYLNKQKSIVSILNNADEKTV